MPGSIATPFWVIHPPKCCAKTSQVITIKKSLAKYVHDFENILGVFLRNPPYFQKGIANVSQVIKFYSNISTT